MYLIFALTRQIVFLPKVIPWWWLLKCNIEPVYGYSKNERANTWNLFQMSLDNLSMTPSAGWGCAWSSLWQRQHIVVGWWNSLWVARTLCHSTPVWIGCSIRSHGYLVLLCLKMPCMLNYIYLNYIDICTYLIYVFFIGLLIYVICSHLFQPRYSELISGWCIMGQDAPREQLYGHQMVTSLRN